MLYFRTCSACMPHSQAPFCHCALRMITNHAEGTFRSLRYSFGGDHPSQTTHQTLSHAGVVSPQISKGPYFNAGSTIPGGTASQPPAYPTHHLPKNNVKL